MGKVVDMLKEQYGHDVWWGLDMQAGNTNFEKQYMPQVIKTKKAGGYGVVFVSKHFVNR